MQCRVVKATLVCACIPCILHIAILNTVLCLYACCYQHIPCFVLVNSPGIKFVLPTCSGLHQALADWKTSATPPYPGCAQKVEAFFPSILSKHASALSCHGSIAAQTTAVLATSNEEAFALPCAVSSHLSMHATQLSASASFTKESSSNQELGAILLPFRRCTSFCR